MASEAKMPHQFGFYTGTAGSVLANFHVDMFTNNGSSADTSTRNTLAITDIGSGYYYASYTPDQPGLYVLAISQTTPWPIGHYIDVADVEEANYVLLTQDTPSANALKASVPISSLYQSVLAQNSDLTQYLLTVVRSSDWQVGRCTPDYAVASTELDEQGNWITSPLTIQHGTYHVVIQNNNGVIRVIKPFLEV